MHIYAHLRNTPVISLKFQCNQFSWLHPLLDVESDRNVYSWSPVLFVLAILTNEELFTADYAIETFMSISAWPMKFDLKEPM